jgi:hypothetical protein
LRGAFGRLSLFTSDAAAILPACALHYGILAMAPLAVQLAVYQRRRDEIAALLERRVRKFGHGEREHKLAEIVEDLDRQIADVQARLHRQCIRRRESNGHKAAPAPVLRPLVHAAPRERRETHRRSRRTAAARGDPDQSDPEIDRRHGAAFLTGQNGALGVSRRDFACWYDRHTSRLDGRPSDPANFEPTWTRAE